MKKNLIRLLSIVLVVVMVMPVAVFADTATGDYTLYYDSTIAEKKTTTITCDGAVSWNVTVGSDFASVDNNGTVTALKAGTAKVSANNAEGEQIGLYTINVLARALNSIEIVEASSESEYVAGTKIKQSNLTVKATYNDGYVDNDFKAYSINPSGALTKDNTSVTVTATDDQTKIASMAINVREIDMEQMVTGISVSAPASNAEYEVGTSIAKSDIKVKITYVGGDTSTSSLAENSDITCDLEFNSAGKYTFSNDDLTAGTKTINVSYAGYTSSVTVKIKDKTTPPAGTDTPTQDEYKAKIYNTSALTKQFKVGDSFTMSSAVEIDLYKNNSRIGTLYGNQIDTGITFTQAETNKTVRITFDYDADGDNVKEKYSLEITGINISADTDSRKLRSISEFELEEDEYPVGYVFDKDDIAKLKVVLYKSNATTNSATDSNTLYSSELSDYDFFSDVRLEVLTSSGSRKTSSRYTILDSDITENDDGDKEVTVRLYYKYYSNYNSSSKASSEKYVDLTIEVGESDISFIYDGELIAIYEDLEDALEYCNKQDPDIDEDDFDVDDVKDSKSITLRLGKDYKISSSFEEFSPYHNIIIDLNGYDLTFYTDTIEIDEDDEDYTITVTNSSKTEAKFIYYDKSGGTLVFGEDDKIVFEYDKELPGFYTVEVSAGSNGKVTASPALSSNKVEVGMGSDVKFTITPDKGYEVDAVKAAGKSVVTDKDNYSVNSSGVATYTLKKVSKDTKVEVTFKETKSDWKNPFSDVRESADYYSAVEFVCTHELFQGTSATTFAPNSTMTRAMFVTVLGRLSGLTDATAKAKYGTTSEFTDVSTSNARITYAVPYINWATENGLIEGYGDGTFGPENYITHQQMYLLMYRYALFVENLRPNISGVSLNMSDRSSVADWASDGVKYAQANNFLVYTSGSRIDPTGNALRSELAQLLEMFCGTVLKWAD